jgi:hypothetical protein
MNQLHPYLVSQLGSARRREMLAQAERQRLALRLQALHRASRQAERAGRRIRRALRVVARLSTDLQA